MSWLRLDANFFQSPTGLVMGYHGRLLFLAALCTSKLGDNRGRIKKRHFTPEYVAHFVGDPAGVTARNVYKEALDNLIELGVLQDDGTHYIITGWKQRQIDPTRNERQARWRQTAKGNARRRRVTSPNDSERREPLGNGSNGDTVCTTSGSTYGGSGESARAAPSPLREQDEKPRRKDPNEWNPYKGMRRSRPKPPGHPSE